MKHHTPPSPDYSVARKRKRSRSFLSGWLRSVSILLLLFVVLSFTLFSLESVVEAASQPVVNGLFYGDGDSNNYTLYATSEHGSHLYVYFNSPTIYVALVVDRSVNDNACSPQSNPAYTQNAGWPNHRSCKRATDSEYASFTMQCTTSPNSWSWQQGYAQKVGGVWLSNETIATGAGTAPPSYDSASSWVWNLTNYEANYPTVPWDLYLGGGPSAAIDNWKSPFDVGNPNVIPNDAYPSTGSIGYSSVYQWEWPMVYEWSADLSVCGNEPIFVLAGESHHSPSKNGDENDNFPPDPNPQPLTDFGDLPDTYSTLLASNGARHTLTINGAHFGTSPDPEIDGQPSSDATGDMMSADDEDGVFRTGATYWQPGNTVNLRLDVQGSTPTADVGIWLDWNADGNFDEANEFYSYMNLPTGGNSIVDVLIPATYSTGQPVNVRARIFNNETDAPGGSLDAGDYEGLATTGEVEDYQWFFGPTAITLVNASTGSPDNALFLVLALTAAALTVTALYIGRRPKPISIK